MSYNVLSNFCCDSNRLTSLDLSNNNNNLNYFTATAQTYDITVNDNNEFDLSTLPGDFDVSKTRNWLGGTINGNILTLNEGNNLVTYEYDVGNNRDIMYVTLKTSSSSSPSSEFLNGDVNGDGKVKMTDVALINAHVKKTKLLTGEELERADINDDGRVNITDVALVNAHVKKVKLLF
jgi:hypothetical protein